MKNEFNLLNEVKIFLADDKEYMKVTPSYYFLDSYASKLLELIKKWKSIDPVIHESLGSIERQITLFSIDLLGELKNDYDKKNKRYREKWIRLKQDIDYLKNILLKIWKEKNNIN